MTALNSLPKIDLSLHPKQGAALRSPATEILYGGAAGGGKSYLMRIAAISWASTIDNLNVYLFRRTYDDLIKNHIEGPRGFRAILGPWIDANFCQIVEKEIRFWNKSKIFLNHCQDEDDVYKYQGAEIHVLLIDELTTFSEKMYRFLRNRVRMTNITLPEQLKGKFPRILCSANPGNIGHLFVRSTFVDAAPPTKIVKQPNSEGGMLRQYIPAKLEDNPTMVYQDPGYEHRLEGLGSPEMVKAMRWGDWSVIAGSFFPEFSESKHTLLPTNIPDHWSRFRAMDWGSAKPFSIHWFAVVPEDLKHNNRWILRNTLIVYKEWYGWNGQPNQGANLTAEQIAQGIIERELQEPRDLNGRIAIAYGVLDRQAFNRDGGPSIAERINKLLTKAQTAAFRPAKNVANSRIPGLDQLRQRLAGTSPSILFFNTCTHLIRTLPALQHDEANPEDTQEGEDHAVDSIRYGVMSRPFIRTDNYNEEQKPIDQATLTDLFKANEAKLSKNKRI
jgi:Phage terminase large subunit